jgi:hypothetical protein
MVNVLLIKQLLGGFLSNTKLHEHSLEVMDPTHWVNAWYGGSFMADDPLYKRP